MSKAPDAMQLERLRRLTELPDEQIDTSDLPVVVDWSRGIRGGTPHEVRQRLATASERHQRSWYRYDFKVGNTVRYTGITQDPRRREIEHRQLWPTGRIIILGAPVSARAAREWEPARDWGSPNLRARKN